MTMGKHFKTTAFFFLLLAIGCNPKTPDSPPVITSMKISPQPANVAFGGTLQVSALGVSSFGGVGDAVPVSSWKSDDTSIATIDSNGIVTGIKIGVTTLSATSGTFRGTVPIGVVSPSPGSADLNISGHAFYEDKPYDQNGFTKELVNTPIRQAVVELIAIDGFTTLASGTTTDEGAYQFSQIKNDTRRGGVYIRVLAKTGDESFNPIAILDDAKNQSSLAVQGPPLNDTTNDSFPSSQIIADASGIGGAFNILDMFLKGSAFIQKIDGCAPPIIKCKLPLLTTYWKRGVASGTFYDSTSNAISINGGLTQSGTTVVTGDTDEYDDAIILHEYGHFVAVRLAHDDSPGDTHTFSDNTQDIRLSWSEGWATFFSGTVLGNPLIVDTKDQGTSFKFDIETFVAFYTTSEAAVSGILWDFFDAIPQDDDPATTIGFDKIWKAFTGIVGSATMESFAIELMRQNPERVDAIQAILLGRKIEMSPDTAEAQGEVSLLLNKSQHHTLYQSVANPFLDDDMIPFSVTAGQTYSIKTLLLTNGADTFLTIEDSGSVLLQNDNADGKTYVVHCDALSPCPLNNGKTLASSISFQSQMTRQLFARVKRSPNAPDSTGITGSYDIQITSP